MDALTRAVEYAQRRAVETGKPYLVTTEGHAAWACAANLRSYKELGCTIFGIFKPLK